MLKVGCERTNLGYLTCIPLSLFHEQDCGMSLWREEVISLGTAQGRVVWLQESRNGPIRVDRDWDRRWVLSFIYKIEARCSVDQW